MTKKITTAFHIRYFLPNIMKMKSSLVYLFLFMWPLIPIVLPLIPLEELHLPQLVMHSSSYNPPLVATLPRHTLKAAWTHAGFGIDPGQIWAECGPIIDFLAAPAAPVPDLVLCRYRQSLKKHTPPPPSELPPVEETGGQWLAVEAKGKQDCFSFINGKVSSLFAPLMMIEWQLANTEQQI